MNKCLVGLAVAAMLGGCASYYKPEMSADAATVDRHASDKVMIVEVNDQRVRADEHMLQLAAGKHKFKVACAMGSGTVQRYAYGNLKSGVAYELEVDDADNCYTMIKQK